VIYIDYLDILNRLEKTNVLQVKILKRNTTVKKRMNIKKADFLDWLLAIDVA
jgi:hypothetical protein